MSTIVRRTVSELPETSRQSIEKLIGTPLEANQRVFIIVEGPVTRRPRSIAAQHLERFDGRRTSQP